MANSKRVEQGTSRVCCGLFGSSLGKAPHSPARDLLSTETALQSWSVLRQLICSPGEDFRMVALVQGLL